jgi:cell division protein FtsN
MVILVFIFIIILGGGGYFVYTYMSQNNQEAAVAPPAADTVVKPVELPVIDTVAPQIDTVDEGGPVVTDSTLENTFRMVIGSYTTRERADKRVTMLSLNGNTVEVVQQDSVNYLVVSPINCRIMDTTHVKDSLRVWFGYKGVRILH